MQFIKYQVAISTYTHPSAAFQPTHGASSQHSECGERCVLLVFHLVHSRAYRVAKQHICRQDDRGKICTMATLHSGGPTCIPRFHDPNWVSFGFQHLGITGKKMKCFTIWLWQRGSPTIASLICIVTFILQTIPHSNHHGALAMTSWAKLGPSLT